MNNKTCRYCGKPATRAIEFKVGLSGNQHIEIFYICDGTPRKACNFQTGHLKEVRLTP